MLIPGSCHCGIISFNLDWEPDPVEIPARACGCSFCTKHGGVWTSSRDAALLVRIMDPERISGYTFGSGTALFHICNRCGVVPLVTSKIEQCVYAVVNVNSLENIASSMLRRTAADFSAEDIDSRLARRKQTWIANVRFINVAVTPDA